MASKIKLIGSAAIIALLLLLGIAWQTIALHKTQTQLAEQRGKTERIKTQHQSLSANYAQAQSTIDTLRNLSRNRAREHNHLQQQLASMTQAADDRVQTLRRLQRENATLRDWANQPLPDLIRRVHNHPTFTSAADYRAYLQHTNALPAKSERAPSKR